MIIINFIFLVAFRFIGADCEELHGSSFQTFINGASIKVNIWDLFHFFLNLVQKPAVVFVGPRVEEGEIHFLLTLKPVLESPLNPPVIVLLGYSKITMVDVFIFSEILVQLDELSGRQTGTSP